MLKLLTIFLNVVFSDVDTRVKWLFFGRGYKVATCTILHVLVMHDVDETDLFTQNFLHIK